MPLRRHRLEQVRISCNWCCPLWCRLFLTSLMIQSCSAKVESSIHVHLSGLLSSWLHLWSPAIATATCTASNAERRLSFQQPDCTFTTHSPGQTQNYNRIVEAVHVKAQAVWAGIAQAKIMYLGYVLLPCASERFPEGTKHVEYVRRRQESAWRTWLEACRQVSLLFVLLLSAPPGSICDRDSYRLCGC